MVGTPWRPRFRKLEPKEDSLRAPERFSQTSFMGGILGFQFCEKSPEPGNWRNPFAAFQLENLWNIHSNEPRLEGGTESRSSQNDLPNFRRRGKRGGDFGLCFGSLGNSARLPASGFAWAFPPELPDAHGPRPNCLGSKKNPIRAPHLAEATCRTLACRQLTKRIGQCSRASMSAPPAFASRKGNSLAKGQSPKFRRSGPRSLKHEVQTLARKRRICLKAPGERKGGKGAPSKASRSCPSRNSGSMEASSPMEAGLRSRKS